MKPLREYSKLTSKMQNTQSIEKIFEQIRIYLFEWIKCFGKYFILLWAV